MGVGGTGASWNAFSGFSEWKCNLGDWSPTVGQRLNAGFLRLDPLFDAPGMNRYSSLTLTEFIRFESLAHLFSQIAMETPTMQGFMPTSPQELRRRFWHKYEQLVTAHDFSANGKPTLYLWTQLEDRTYPRWSISFAEYIRRTYKEQANTVISTTMSPNYADMWSDENMFYGPNPRIDPLHGLDSRPFEEDYTTLRAARESRVHCLEYPFLSAPLLLDPDGSLSCLRLPQSDNHLNIIDKQGLLCEHGWDWQLLSVTGGWSNMQTFYESFSDALENQFAHKEIILRAVIANHGHYVKDIGDTLLTPTYPRRQFTTLDYFIVRSFDEKNGILHAGWFKPTSRAGSAPDEHAPDTAAVGDIHFHFAADTRIVLRQPDGRVMLNRLADVKPGLRFWADFMLTEPTDGPRISLTTLATHPEQVHPLHPFDMSRYADKEIDTVRIQNWMRSMQSDEYMMQLYGHLTARVGDIITVRIAKDELKAMYGARFWQQDHAIADPNRATGGLGAPTALYRDTIRRWLDGTDADRTYRFALDHAVRVFRNGKYEDVTIADLQVGDYIWATYETFWETGKRYREAIYPERIYASSSVEVTAESARVKPLTQPTATPIAIVRPVDARIAYAPTSITLDGYLWDWAGVATMPAPFMKRNDSMLSFVWREDGLYGIAQVTDAQVKSNAAQPWTGDCLELWLEKDNAKAPATTLRAVQFIFAPPSSGKEGDAPIIQVPYGGFYDLPENVRCGWKKTAEGYNLEFFIPARLLSPARMKTGTMLGLNACVNDDGKPLEQLMADKNVNNGFRNPSTWGTVELIGGGMDVK